MPFLFALLLFAAPALAGAETDPASFESQPEQFSYSITETTKTTASAVNRQPAILHEPIVDEESSAIARDEASVMSQVLESNGSED